MAEQPAANRTHHEADREQDGGIQLLNDRVAAGKEGRGKIQRKCRVGIEVIPLDQIADRPDENRPYPAGDVGEVRFAAVLNDR